MINASKFYVIFIVSLAALIVFFYILFCREDAYQDFAAVDTVYHGSPHANVKIFEPKNNHIRDSNEGPVVFATPSLKIASCYLFKWDDSWVHQSIQWKNGDKSDYQVNMIISDKKRFNKEDRGGAIYILPVQGFRSKSDEGLGIYELTRKGPVVPMLKITLSSALAAMKKFGVKVYFLDLNQFQKYLSLSSNKHAQKIFLQKS